MLSVLLFTLSIAFQLAVVVLALSHIRKSGPYMWAWACLSAALALMVIRRSIPFMNVLLTGNPPPGTLSEEFVAFAISAFMMAGVIGLSRLLKDVNRRKDDLDRAVTDLRRSNKELEQFAYVASHDLNEPLRMIASYLQLIERRLGGRLDGEIKEFMDYAQDGAKRMRLLIDGLLEYSRVGRRGEPKEGVDLDAILHGVLADLKSAIETSGAKIAADKLPAVTGVEAELRRTLMNLIGNALKFHAPDRAPELRVGAIKHPQDWEIFVADNGIGIEPEHFEKVFQMFKRLHGQSEYPGTGLGLALAKRIIDSHGGRIWIESEPGKGSTFRFTLPRQDK